MDNQISRRDLPWVVLIILSFTLGLAASWQRWGNPLVDCGREMNQPLRLAQGEMLYSDVRHIYGPLSPYVNATLYKVFGPSLSVLYAEGIITAIIILALVYWLSRRLMNPLGATAATLSAMWLCAFKQAGNYVLPYTYSALHGCALGLAALALLVRFVERAGSSPIAPAGGRDGHIAGNSKTSATGFAGALYLVMAGVAAGLTMLAKTEMGLAALIAGIAAIGLAGYPNLRRSLVMAALFFVPASALVIGVYGQIAAQVGWHTLSHDSFLFLQNLPPELVYFNKRMSGFDEPLVSLSQMIGALARVVTLAVVIGTVSLLLTRRDKQRASSQIPASDQVMTNAGQASYGQLWMLLGFSTLLFVMIAVAGYVGWDKGPYLAMPVLLAALLVLMLVQYFRRSAKTGGSNNQTLTIIVIAVYALASLARVALRVRSGGAYSSYLLPASVILFTYGWAHPFADMFREGRTRRLAGGIAIGLIMIDVVATAGLLSYRYRARNTHPVTTERGTIVAVPDLGQAFNQAISFIDRETGRAEPVAVMPEGTSLNFLTGRPNPLREEILTPGYLDEQGEDRAISQLIASNTRLVLVTNRATPEFGPPIFGRDYCKRLMQWIEANFEQAAIFGPSQNPELQIGDRTFFIRAYRRKDEG